MQAMMRRSHNPSADRLLATVLHLHQRVLHPAPSAFPAPPAAPWHQMARMAATSAEPRMIIRTDRPIIRTEFLIIRTDRPIIRTECLIRQTDRLIISADEQIIATDRLIIAADQQIIQTVRLIIRTEFLIIRTDRPIIRTEFLISQPVCLIISGYAPSMAIPAQRGLIRQARPRAPCRASHSSVRSIFNRVGMGSRPSRTIHFQRPTS